MTYAWSLTVLVVGCCLALSSCSTTERERTEQQVLAWFERFPPSRMAGTLQPRGVPYQTWEQWDEAGRAIPGAEAVLIDWYHHNPTRFSRQFVIEALVAVGSQESVPVLVEALGDEDPMCRIMGAQVLGKIGGPVAEEALREVVASVPWEVEACEGHSYANLLKVNAMLSLAAIRARVNREDAIRLLAGYLRQPDLPGPARRALEMYGARISGPD